MSEDPKDARPTVRFDPSTMRSSWPLVIASLEKHADWGVFALRLGTLALAQECVRELANRSARPEVLVRLRELVEALAHMPLDA